VVKPLVIPLVKSFLTFKVRQLSGVLRQCLARRCSVWQGKDILQSIYFTVHMWHISRITKCNTIIFKNVLQNVIQLVRQFVIQILTYDVRQNVRHFSFTVWPGGVLSAEVRQGLVLIRFYMGSICNPFRIKNKKSVTVSKALQKSGLY